MATIARDTGYIRGDIQHISQDIRNQTTVMIQAVQTVYNAIQNQTLTIQQIANQMMREINQIIPEIQQLTRIQREQMATAIETVINQQREQWTDGANAFALAPGVAIGYEHNIHTINELKSHGYTIYSSSEIDDSLASTIFFSVIILVIYFAGVTSKE